MNESEPKEEKPSAIAPAETANSNGESDETASKTPPKSPFAVVIGRLLRPEELLSLDGRSGRGEYWATYLLVVMPLVIVFGIAYGIGHLSDYVQTHAVCISIAACAMSLANLVFLPAMVRRVRDLALPPWAALVLMAVCLLPFVKWLGMLAVVVLGCLGSKGGAAPSDGGRLTPRACCIYWLIAVALVTMNSGRLGVGFCDGVNDRMDQELDDYMG